VWLAFTSSGRIIRATFFMLMRFFGTEIAKKSTML